MHSLVLKALADWGVKNIYGVSGNAVLPFIPPEMAAFAKACGAKGIRVDDPEMLPDAIIKAVAFDRPVVVDVISNESKPGFI